MGHRSSKKAEPATTVQVLLYASTDFTVGVTEPIYDSGQIPVRDTADPFAPAVRAITDVELLSVDGDTGGVGGVILPNKKMAVSDLSTPGDVVMASNGEQFRVHVEPVGEQHSVTFSCDPAFELSPAVVDAIWANRPDAVTPEAQAMGLAAILSDTAHYAAERAAATDAGARAAEDKMDQYERLLDAGEVRPIEVLCRAAMHSPPPAPFYGICGAYLRKRKGVQCADRNRARQMVKRWVEEGLPVPLAAWDLLVAALPASKLKERLHAMREVRS